MDEKEQRTANSIFAIGGVQCSADSFVVAESSVLRINICGKNPAHRQAPKRYMLFYKKNSVIQFNKTEFNLCQLRL